MKFYDVICGDVDEFVQADSPKQAAVEALKKSKALWLGKLILVHERGTPEEEAIYFDTETFER